MAELSPIPSGTRPSESSYQPISGYAVASACATIVFSLCLIAVTYFAVTESRSALWDWILVFAISGVVLAILARFHIRKSEGTRTGAGIASACWWVCVLGGVSFSAYLFANQYVLERESRNFADKFFGELKAGKFNQGFVYLIPPVERDRAAPEDNASFETTYAKSGFPDYQRHPITRLFKRHPGTDITVEHVGVKDVGQEGNGFKATHIFAVRSPDGLFDVQVKLMAAEKAGKTQWYIPGPQYIAVKDRELTSYGRMTEDLEGEASSFASMWMLNLAQDRQSIAHTYTYPTADRESFERLAMGTSYLAGGSVLHLPLDASYLPEARRVAQQNVFNAAVAIGGGLVAPIRVNALAFEDLSDLEPPFFRKDIAMSPLSAEQWSKWRRLWSPPRLSPAVQPRVINEVTYTPESPSLSIENGQVTVVLHAEVYENAVTYSKCYVGVVSDNPDIASALIAAKAPGAKLTNLPSRNWRIAWIRSDLEPQAIRQAPPGGPDAPGGPGAGR